MPLLGQAAVAMWWDMAQAQRGEFEDWHSHEHFPERMSIPGFRRGTRWASIDNDAISHGGFFVLYELEAFEILTSATYRQRLDNPTPWSTKMMPHHRNMMRSQSRVLESAGSGVAGFAATLRLSPKAGRDDALRQHLRETLRHITTLPGLVGGHLLRTETPATAPTREQKIRGGDAAADWIVLVMASDEAALRATVHGLNLPDTAPGTVASLFRLAHSITPADL
ncbi:MAG: hypothetical protein ABI439_08985 [Rhodospirillales bacterium]